MNPPARLAALLALAGFTLIAPVQSAPRTGEAGPAPPSGTERRGDAIARADRELLVNLALAGHAQVEAAKIALQKSKNPEVQRFAQRMLNEHTQLHGRIKVVADSLGVRLPDDPGLSQKLRLKRLEASDGADFDAGYAEHYGVVSHREAVEGVRKQLAEGRHSKVKSLASDLLPALQEHLVMGRTLHEQVDPLGKTSQTPSKTP
jgi:putative membrane protein